MIERKGWLFYICPGFVCTLSVGHLWAIYNSYQDYMNNSSHRIAALIFKFLKEELDEAESKELNAWRAFSSRNEALLDKFSSEEGFRTAILDHSAAQDKHWTFLQAAIAEEAQAPVRKMIGWRRIAVAASFIGLIGLAAFFILYNKQQSNTGQPNVAALHDVDPGKERAFLLLADGTKILLDETPDGVLATEGNASIAKQNGVISYKNTGSKERGVVMNTIVVPKGGIYQIVLPDGSHVWLNSATTLQYPTSFDGSKREVKLDGEAYFEIKQLSSITGNKVPFKVDISGSAVEVLGTHFNVMGYADEASINTTLLEGSVRVVKGDNEKILIPGQQGQVNRQGNVTVLSSVDTDEVLAWKNGRFQFARVSLDVIMRQLERWYDVKVIYQDKIPDEFVGGLERDVQLSQVLKLLELTELVRFKVEGKTITVMKGKS